MKACLGPLPPRSPHPALPDGTVDTHCHVIGPAERYPFSDGRTYTPPDAPVAALAHVRETLGIDRSVVVQPGAHGFDNRVTFDAVAALGDRARGIAVVPASTPVDELERMHAAGIRGVRLSSLLRDDAGLDGTLPMAGKIAPLGWHILIHLKTAAELVDLAPHLREAPVPIVIDHMARTTGAEGPGSPAFRTLIDLLETTSNCWTKVSSWYRLSARADHADMAEMARAVITCRPDRIVWGTNWPHPLLFDPPMPDDAGLAEQFLEWAGGEAHRILVENPRALYDFGSSSR